MAGLALLLAAALPAAADLAFHTVPDRGDGYTVVRITYDGSGDNTGTWTVPADVSTVEVLVVGGGGGAWNDNFQSGCGAGGMYYSNSYAVTPGPIGITVGTGADHGTGESTLFGTKLIAYGGTKGNGYTDGGDQGGYSLDGGTTVIPGNLGMHYSPMDGNWCSGGGAGHAGYKGDAQLGGEGAACSITGTQVHYAGGGGAPSSYGTSVPLGTPGYNVGGGGSGPPSIFADHAFSGIDGLGGGGGGGWGGGGGAGGDGVVIIAYQSSVTFYTVSFNSNGGSAVESQMVAKGGTATVPTPPTWVGHAFVKWCSDEALTTPFDFATAITADRTLHAKWLTDYVVTFESNGGSAVAPQYIAPPGGPATEPTPPTWVGHVFVNWCSDAALTTPFDFGTTITADTTLYAKWLANSYTLTYRADPGGSISGTTPQTVDHGSSGATVTAVPDPGYRLVKWSDGLLSRARTDSNVTGDLTVTASFAALPTDPITPASSITRGDGSTVHTFSAGSGVWTVPAGVTSVEVLVVGGGGGCWNDDFQSGCGAGGMCYSASYAVTPGPVVITVGQGADHGTGEASFFGNGLIAYGGTKGDGYTNGGDQGSHSLDGALTIVPGNPGMHYSPMDGNWCSGGGAGHAGYKGDSQLGGEGAACSITGTELYYAGGGGSPSSYASSGGTGSNLGGGGTGPEVFGGRAVSGIDGLGGGAGGGWGGGGGAGGDGVVIVAYRAGGTTPYQAWDGLYAADLSDPNGDYDGDRVSNYDEFAFGLDPTSASSVNPFTDLGGLKGGSFRYTRYAASGLTYTVWTSTDLKTWAEEKALTQEEAGPPVGGVQTWLVTFDSSPTSDKLFVRVRAAE